MADVTTSVEQVKISRKLVGFAFECTVVADCIRMDFFVMSFLVHRMAYIVACYLSYGPTVMG